MSSALVLPSPLLGPTAYAPLARSMTDAGLDTSVALLPAEPFTPTQVRRAFGEQARAVDLLVPHSNSGLYAAAAATEAGCAATVYVDAALPGPSAPTTTLAPPAFLAMLRDLADDGGRLPAWTRWWPESEVRALFPQGWFERVDAMAPQLSVAYFTATVPVPAGWEDRPSAYLAFGDTYAEERRQAAASGWPVTVMQGHHLHLLTAPDEVADGVAALAGRLGMTGLGR